jgi:hypothetical protein
LLRRELVVVDGALMRFTAGSKLDGLVAETRARRSADWLAHCISGLPCDRHSTFDLRA